MTKEFSKSMTYEDAEAYYDQDYVFRGSIIGPITAEDVRETQKRFNVMGAYPDLKMEQFGFTVDPQNPYRCYYFERWVGTNTESLQFPPKKRLSFQHISCQSIGHRRAKLFIIVYRHHLIDLKETRWVKVPSLVYYKMVD